MRSGWNKEFLEAFSGAPVAVDERQCLLSLLQLVKIELKRIDFSYHGDVPTRVARHTRKMKDAEKYIEIQLLRLNEKENLYEG